MNEEEDSGDAGSDGEPEKLLEDNLVLGEFLLQSIQGLVGQT